MNIAIIFDQFGPYHHARVAALQAASDEPVIPVQMAARTGIYEWSDAVPVECEGLVTLCPGSAESLSALQVFFAARRFFRDHQIGVVLLPSYSPSSSLAVLLAAMSCGVRRVMMNESHAGTERAKGWKRSLKRWLVGRFHACLVGGAPQKRHFAALGMDEATIFTGYDAIDDGFFAGEAARVREDPEGWRKRHGLPDRYILSLGRMVEKKNLGCLVEAYAELRQRLGEHAPAMVIVGSGDQEPALREQCIELGLQIVDPIPDGRIPLKTENLKLKTHPDSVWMPGFRQIHENPAFYALAECFVLPSLWEEWGLVVNEAMACGLPVVVSNTAGCAEDLVKDGENGFRFDPSRPEELTEALAKLADNPALREAMGRKSRDIIRHWDCDNFAKNALAAIKSATKR